MAVNPIIVSPYGRERVKHGFLEADSMSFVAGELVYLSSAKAVTNYGTDGGEITGIAMNAATNVTSGNAEIQILTITEFDLVAFYCRTTATAKAAADFQRDNYSTIVASNICYADFADTGNEILSYVGYNANLNDATSYVGLFHILSSVLTWPGG